jgi:putative ATP-dependent endonuclease of OLD family
MRIDRLQITNFRNFKALDVRLGGHAVIVGENRAGKSNLLHALRLVLDPSLPDTARQLREEDFWDGLERPLSADDRIIISVDFADFAENEALLASLAEHLVSSEPMVARVTYVFERIAGSEDANDYDFSIYGGDRPENVVHSEIRRRLPLDLLPALRDAESDLANRRRSPLGALLDQLVADADTEEIDEIGERVTEGMTALAEMHAIKELADDVTTRLESMVGSGHSGDFQLGVGPTDPQRLIRALRPLIDAGRRGISEASLGSASLIFLALKSLEFELLVDEGRRDHTFLSIEEPEAHLHPHLQRLTFRHFLEQRGAGGDTTILLTTHSPHIVSVAPLRTLVVLRRAEDGASTEAFSTAQLELADSDVADLERYLDVTRGEMVFSRGVLLVEGDAEKFLVPVLAELNGFQLDELGITVCSVAGTNFLPYVKLLGTTGLQIPHAVLTDLDVIDNRSYGAGRVRDLLTEIGQTVTQTTNTDAIRAQGALHGFFLNNATFEVDLFHSGRHNSMTNTIRELTTVQIARKRAQQWHDDPSNLDEEQFLADVTKIGKGRYAQRLASVISTMRCKHCPQYILDAIKYVADRIH